MRIWGLKVIAIKISLNNFSYYKGKFNKKAFSNYVTQVQINLNNLRSCKGQFNKRTFLNC